MAKDKKSIKKLDEFGVDYKIYPLFSEVDVTIKDINRQFEKVNFDVKGVLSSDQEKTLLDFLNNPNFDFKMQTNINNLNGLESKLNTALISKSMLSEEVRNRINLNIVDIKQFREKIEGMKSSKNKLNSMRKDKNKDKKETEKSDEKLSLTERNELNKVSESINHNKRIENKNEKSENEKSEGQGIKYVDNVNEDTFFRFNKYNPKTNQIERISMNAMMNELDKRMNDITKYFDMVEKVSKDEKYIAYHQENVKFDLLMISRGCEEANNWCNNLLNVAGAVKLRNKLDKMMVDKLGSCKEFYNKLQSQCESKMAEFENHLDANKDKYNKIVKDDIENEIENNYINKITLPEQNNPEQSKNKELSLLYEKFMIINRKIEFLDDNHPVKKEYSQKLIQIHSEIKNKLKEEKQAKDRQNEDKANQPQNHASVKIKDFSEMSEEDKIKIAKNPNATLKIFDAIMSGEIATKTGTRKLTDAEKSNLNSLLDDINMYRLQEQGLVDVKVEEKDGGKDVTVTSKNGKDLSILKMKTSLKLKAVKLNAVWSKSDKSEKIEEKQDEIEMQL